MWQGDTWKPRSPTIRFSQTWMGRRSKLDKKHHLQLSYMAPALSGHLSQTNSTEVGKQARYKNIEKGIQNERGAGGSSYISYNQRRQRRLQHSRGVEGGGDS